MSRVLAVAPALSDPARFPQVEGFGVTAMEFTCVMNGVTVSVKCDESVVKKGEDGTAAPPKHDKIGTFIGNTISGAHALFEQTEPAKPGPRQPGR